MRRIVAVFLCLGVLSCVATAQEPKPYSKSDVLAMLKDEGQKAHIADLLADRRPSFDFSPGLVKEWQAAGLSKEQLDAMLGQQEVKAIAYIRTFNTALITYASTYNKGFPLTLAPLGLPAKGVQPTAEKADLIMEWLASGHPGGNYTFVYTPGSQVNGQVARYTIVAQPLVQREGLRSFFTDQSAVLRGTKENRAATVNDPPL